MKIREKFEVVVQRTLLSVAGVALLVGCGSSIKKADIPSTANPTEEIARLESDLSEAETSQLDVLAANEYEQSHKYLKRAREGLRKEKKQRAVLDDIGYARAYLERAQTLAAERRNKVEGLLSARSEALTAGAKNIPTLKDKLGDYDKELRRQAEKKDSQLEAKDFSRLQAGYQAIELSAIQTQQVGRAQALIQGAVDKGAGRNAPTTLKRAQNDLQNAKNVIAANRHDSATYAEAVNQANTSAQFLVDVLAVTQRKGADLDEAAAIKIVTQDYQIRDLRNRLGDTQAEVQARDEALAGRDRTIAASAATLSIQESLKEAQRQFDTEEAEAYQQGDKLLIRLKSLEFPSGRADLPAQSLALLAKVKTIADHLNPSEIVVEGHTDSTGNRQANAKLSQDRAAAVAKYFEASGVEADKIETKGYGFQKPIASNKSKEGRAQNRRVDVVITPGPAPEAAPKAM